MSVWDVDDDVPPKVEITPDPTAQVELTSILECMRRATELNQVQDYLNVDPDNDPSDPLATVELSDSDENVVHSIWQADTSDGDDTPAMPGTPQNPSELDDSETDPPTDNIQSIIERINTKLQTQHQQPTPDVPTVNLKPMKKSYYLCPDCNELHTDTEDSDDSDNFDDPDDHDQ